MPSTIAVAEVHRLLEEKADVALIDVREPFQRAAGRIAQAHWIPRSSLELEIESKARREQQVVVFCQSGSQSLLAAETLAKMGYRRVASMAGGFDRRIAEDLPTEGGHLLTGEQRERYRRHLVLPQIGEEGQRRLLDARVAIAGVGGLGSPVALYLAAAGVGTLGLIDSDVVDISNLQRQVLHGTDRLGVPKTESGRRALAALDPAIKVVAIQERLGRDNVLELLKGYDLVVNACDNFATRYLLNDACVMLGKPNVDGAVFRFEGQVDRCTSRSRARVTGACSPAAASRARPSCAEAGVLGVLPGVIGLLQANEAIKLLLGIGEPLVGRLLTFDALKAEFHALKVRRDPRCPVCGDGATPTLGEYAEGCAAPK